jgi:hypothetical protein
MADVGVCRTDANWTVPGELSLDEGLLWWRFDQGTTEQIATPKVLTDFASIHRHDDTDAALLDFARRYGPLHLCRHGKPSTHIPPQMFREVAPWLDEAECSPCWMDEERFGRIRRPGWRAERVEPWLVYSAAADAMMKIGSVLAGAVDGRDDLLPEAFAALGVFTPAPVDTVERLQRNERWEFLTAPDSDPPKKGPRSDKGADEAIGSRKAKDEYKAARAAEREAEAAATADAPRRQHADAVRRDIRLHQRRVLTNAAQSWLDMGGISLELDWGEPRWRRPDLTLTYPSLFSGLGLELALFLSGRAQIVFCSACKLPFAPRRQPAPGKRSWCPDNPECRKAKNRFDAAKRRAPK